MTRRATSRLKLSLCMIIKNEEEYLNKCLESARPFVDELIVVDTGSTDSSEAIARRYGANVYFHEWENDFAKHRNQSISYATGDWILILDGDEELMEGSGRTIREKMEYGEGDSVAVQVLCPFNNGLHHAMLNQVRVFRNNGCIRYEGIVHNKVVGCNKTVFCQAGVWHHGYNLDPPKMKRKFERTTGLLKRQLARNPNDHMAHRYMAASYLSMSECDPRYNRLAREEAELAIKMGDQRDAEKHSLACSCYIAAAASLNMGDCDRGLKMALKGLNYIPNYLDCLYIAAKVYDQKGELGKAEGFAQNYLSIRDELDQAPQRFGKLHHNTYWAKWAVLAILAKCKHDQGNSAVAVRLFQESYICSGKSSQVCRMAGQFYLESRLYEEAERWLLEAKASTSDKIVMYLLGECYARQNKVAEHIHLLSEIVHRYPEERDNIASIGIVQFERSNYTLARWCLGKALELGCKQDIRNEYRIASQWVDAENGATACGNSKAKRRDAVTVSACLMVKDEEKLLGNCLESICRSVDEIVLVDTGSSDNTVEIAGRFGAKVFFHDWENDFSKHRNQSISYATGEWILIIDADEVLDLGSVGRIRERLNTAEGNAVCVEVVNYMCNRTRFSVSSSPRLLRNHVGCHYKGIVHNQVCFPGEAEGSSIRILHYGYDLSPDKMKEKFRRTQGLLQAQVKADRDAVFPRLNLAVSKLNSGHFAEAAREGVKAIKLIQAKGINHTGYARLFYVVSGAYYNLREYAKAEEFAKLGIEYCPEHLDSWFVLSMVSDSTSSYEKVVEYGRKYCELYDRIMSSELPESADYLTIGDRWRLLLAMSQAYHQLGDQIRAIRLFEEASDDSGDILFPEPEKAKFCFSIGAYDMAKRHLENAFVRN